MWNFLWRWQKKPEVYFKIGNKINENVNVNRNKNEEIKRDVKSEQEYNIKKKLY